MLCEICGPGMEESTYALLPVTAHLKPPENFLQIPVGYADVRMSVLDDQIKEDVMTCI